MKHIRVLEQLSAVSYAARKSQAASRSSVKLLCRLLESLVVAGMFYVCQVPACLSLDTELDPVSSCPAGRSRDRTHYYSHPSDFCGHSRAKALFLIAQGGKGVRTKQSPISQDGKITNHGQIKNMALPPGWVEGVPDSASSFREIHPPDAPRSMLCFFYRGLPSSEQAGKSFHDLLAEQPHELTRAESDSIKEILRGMEKAEDFTTNAIRTEELHGKRVLIVEGRYNKIQEDTLALFVDADAISGRVVQEIYYQAPREQYPLYLQPARAAINSIEWKEQ